MGLISWLRDGLALVIPYPGPTSFRGHGSTGDSTPGGATLRLLGGGLLNPTGALAQRPPKSFGYLRDLGAPLFTRHFCGAYHPLGGWDFPGRWAFP